MRNAARQSDSLSYRVFLFTGFSIFFYRQDNPIYCLTAFCFSLYMYITRQDNFENCLTENIFSCTLQDTARQSLRLSYRDSNDKTITYNCLTHLLHFIFFISIRIYTHSHTIFQVLIHKLASSCSHFSSFLKTCRFGFILFSYRTAAGFLPDLISISPDFQLSSRPNRTGLCTFWVWIELLSKYSLSSCLLRSETLDFDIWGFSKFRVLEFELGFSKLLKLLEIIGLIWNPCIAFWIVYYNR